MYTFIVLFIFIVIPIFFVAVMIAGSIGLIYWIFKYGFPYYIKNTDAVNQQFNTAANWFGDKLANSVLLFGSLMLIYVAMGEKDFSSIVPILGSMSMLAFGITYKYSRYLTSNTNKPKL